MLFNPKHEDRLGRLADQLRFAQAVTPALLADVIADACTRLAVLNRLGKADRLNQLIKAGAWTDAALAVTEIELPQWQLRRLACEDGEWLCSLSRQPYLPVALDETVDASHESLPLAILSAFVEARRRSAAVHDATSRSVPHVRPEQGLGICCDNFA